MKKRILCGLLCGAMALSITSCGGESASSAAGGSSAPASGGASGTEGNTPVTVFCPNTSSMPITNDTLVIKTLAEKTKTDFQFVNSPTTGTEEKFNLMMASGDIPDLVVYVADPIIKYAKAFAPLNDLINNNCPNYAKLLSETPTLRKDITAADGNIYTIQSIAPFKFANAIIVRQDWLDKLGLPVPVTLDDYHNVLKAFKEKDPNGNGQADEIPFSSGDKRRYDAETPGLSIFDASFGIDEDFYLSENGDEILFGAIDPRMKEALAYLNTLYSEGLIDQEYLTRDSDSWQGLITEEKAGMWIAWGVGVDDDSLIKNPDVDLEIILPPAGADGEVRIFSQMPQTRTNALAISKNSKVKEHIMDVWNYIFSDEGYMLTNFGVEGTTYEMVDGQAKFKDEYFNGDTSPMGMLRREGINSWFPLKQSKEAEIARSPSDKFPTGIDTYEAHMMAPVPPLKFTDEEKSTITSVYTGEIKTYMDETLDGFITGKNSLDQFDDFVAQMNKMGLPDILKIYNDALKRYNTAQ